MKIIIIGCLFCVFSFSFSQSKNTDIIGERFAIIDCKGQQTSEKIKIDELSDLIVVNDADEKVTFYKVKLPGLMTRFVKGSKLTHEVIEYIKTHKSIEVFSIFGTNHCLESKKSSKMIFYTIIR